MYKRLPRPVEATSEVGHFEASPSPGAIHQANHLDDHLISKSVNRRTHGAARRPPRPSDFLTGASRIRNKCITTIDGYRIAVCFTRTLADPRSGIGPTRRWRRRATPSMHCPGYRQPLTDAAIGTPFTRVTDPGQQILTGISRKPAYCTHRHSGSQASNADQSPLLIANGCSGF
jgi:hypothetical protein